MQLLHSIISTMFMCVSSIRASCTQQTNKFNWFIYADKMRLLCMFAWVCWIPLLSDFIPDKTYTPAIDEKLQANAIILQISLRICDCTTRLSPSSVFYHSSFSQRHAMCVSEDKLFFVNCVSKLLPPTNFICLFNWEKVFFFCWSKVAQQKKTPNSQCTSSDSESFMLHNLPGI